MMSSAFRRPSARVLGLVLTVFAVTAAAPAPKLPVVPAEVAVENPPVFPLSKVKRGLKGYGYTVFASADGPERFEFEVLGVMRNYLGPGEDLIIAQLKGAKIERTGVIAGMSGSPVYVGDKLVGAVGYRFGAFTKDPIAGITPIERMLASTKATAKGVAVRSPATGDRIAAPVSAWGQATPIGIPVAASGLHPAALSVAQTLLADRGYGPVLAAAGSTRGGKTAEKLFASGPIAGLLVDGDISMAGIGTVTWVHKDRFLAFGHPFQGTGMSEMPVSNAEILTTVASQSASWKLGQATTPIGRLTDDRLHAIGGVMGRAPRTVKLNMTLELEGPLAKSDAKQKRMSFTVVRDPDETAVFTAITLVNTIASRIGVERGGTLTVAGVGVLETGERVNIEHRVAMDGSNAFLLPLALGVIRDLGSVTQNRFKDAMFKSVDLKVRWQEKVDKRRVVAVDVTKTLRAGERGEVRVRLAPWKGKTEEVRVPVRVPAGLKPGRYRLVVAGPYHARQLEEEGALNHQPQSFDQFLSARDEAPPAGSVSVYLLSDDDPGVRLEGTRVPVLPPSLAGVLSEGGGWSGRRVEQDTRRIARKTYSGVVNGRAKAKVTVRAHDSDRAKEAR